MFPEIDVVADLDGHSAHLAWSLSAAGGTVVGPVFLGLDAWLLREDDPVAPSTRATSGVFVLWRPPGEDNLQFDAGVEAGLTRAAPDLEIYLGVTRRF